MRKKKKNQNSPVFQQPASGYVERKLNGGRYQDASELVQDALRRMEAAEVAAELQDFERAFAGGHEAAEDHVPHQ